MNPQGDAEKKNKLKWGEAMASAALRALHLEPHAKSYANIIEAQHEVGHNLEASPEKDAFHQMASELHEAACKRMKERFQTIDRGQGFPFALFYGRFQD